MNDTDAPARAALPVALALSLASAVSLGLARFSYALLLPAMRADLGWSFFLAGAMNTVNAAGYLVGALLSPRLLARFGPRAVLLAGGSAAALLLAAHGLVLVEPALLALRFAVGVASAASFVGGGLLAARLAGGTAAAGLVLGIYYGGTGLGIIASAWVVPPLVERTAAHAWQGAWWALGVLALLATAVTARATRHLGGAPAAGTPRLPFRWAPLRLALGAYLMFGLGYIGYMTFVITLLRQQGLSAAQTIAFFTLLGAGVVASSWLWAGLLQRCRGGQALGLLNGLLAFATLLPVLTAHTRGGVPFWRALRRGVPVGGRVDHGARAAQPAERRLAWRHRGVHDRVRGRADRRAERGRLGGRRAGRPGARLRRVGGGAGTGLAARPAAAAAGASGQLIRAAVEPRLAAT